MHEPPPFPRQVNSTESPPAAAEEPSLDELRLAMTPGIGPRLRQALLARFGSAEAVFLAPPSDLRAVGGIGAELAKRLVLARDEIDPRELIALCREKNVTMISDRSPCYPAALREIHDPPGVLFAQGEFLPQDAVAVAVVGSRHATQYGLNQAERLAAGLARAGATVVSGLARGIDAAAHRGALNAGGRTIAVLGSGVLCVYPPEHRGLADEAIASGALLSEAPPLSPPLAGAFPQRNRIISGLALGVVVVEASAQSGALITARHAMEQGREVFAVPGRVDVRSSRGCHRLIRDGAKLVETVEDILEELGPLVAPAVAADGHPLHSPAELLLNDQERKVLAAIDVQPTEIDRIVAQTGLAAGQVLSTISVLEMRSLIRRAGGARVARR